MNDQYRRKVGAVRPSHLMFTTGVGALVDLPNFSVLVSGLDRWRYDNVPNHQPIDEPRLLAAVQKILNNRHVKELRPAPWVDDDGASNSLADRVGVPTIPFPTWLRCTACNELAPLASKTFLFENDQSNRPHDARFYHERCGKKKSRKPLAVPTRFMLACTAGHLDDFPYREFVHRGQPCPTGSTHPRMQMEDRGGNIGVNVNLKCLSCETQRNIRDALGDDGTTLPNCRGRHPHLDVFEENGCDQRARVLVVGSSNQWFAHTLSVLSLPRSPRSDLDDLVEQHWKQIEPLAPAMYPYARDNVPAFRVFDKWDDNELAAAVERVRARKTQDGEQDE
ncbi:MAG: DrmB family protein, partial [Thermobifida fusca]